MLYCSTYTVGGNSDSRINLVGVPLKDSRITRVSDLFALEGIKDNVSVVIVSDNGFNGIRLQYINGRFY